MLDKTPNLWYNKNIEGRQGPRRRLEMRELIKQATVGMDIKIGRGSSIVTITGKDGKKAMRKLRNIGYEVTKCVVKGEWADAVIVR